MASPRTRRWSRAVALASTSLPLLLGLLPGPAEAGGGPPAQPVAGRTCLVARSTVDVRVATFNVNFALPPAAVDQDLDATAPHTDLLMAQEAKNVDVDRLLGSGWHTHQDLARDDRQGTAVAWRDGPPRLDSGYALGVRPGGAAMLTRWISWADLRVGDRVVRFASTHRPPPRYAFRWSDFDANVGRWVRRSPHPVVLGLDSNTTHHAVLERRTGLDWHGVGIDGFLTNLPLSDVRALPKGHSDHHAVVGDLHLAGRTAATAGRAARAACR